MTALVPAEEIVTGYELVAHTVVERAREILLARTISLYLRYGVMKVIAVRVESVILVGVNGTSKKRVTGHQFLQGYVWLFTGNCSWCQQSQYQEAALDDAHSALYLGGLGATPH